MNSTNAFENLADSEYKWGFVTDIESETAPKGLSEQIIQFISAKKKRTSMVVGISVESLQALANDGRTSLAKYSLPPH